MDLASLGVRIETTGAAEGAAQLDKLDASAKRVQKSAGGTAAAMDKTSASAAQLKNATRQLPAQFTDIFTSLQGGQKPLNVLIQQGGQIKDSFGSIREALKGTAGFAAGLISPLTIAAGAVTALAAAWLTAESEAQAFGRAIIASGNYAGQSVSSLKDTAKALSNIAGTTHAAAGALAEITESGKFTSDQLYAVGAAAVSMSRTTGQAVGETINQFGKLADTPTKSIVALNNQYHFLSASVYEQIKALEDQGRTQDAATLAIKTYSDVAVERANAVEGSLNNLQRGWIRVKDAALDAVDAMVGGVGRSSTIADQIQKLGEKINDVAEGNGPIYAGLSAATREQTLATMRKQLAELTRQEQQELRASYLESSKASVASAAIAFDQEAAGYGTAEQKRAREIAAAHTKANDLVAKAFEAGDIKLAAQIQANEKTIVAGIADKYKDPKSKRQKLDPDFYTEDRKQIEAEIAAEGKLLDQKTRIAAAIGSYRDGLQELIAARANDITLQTESYGLGSREIAQRQQLNQVLADAARKRLQLVHDMNATTDDDTRELYARELEALDKYTQQRTTLELKGFKDEDAARADWKNGIKSAYADILDDGRNVAGQTHDVFVNAYDAMGDSIANFVTKGKLDFKSLATSILSDLAKMETRIAASQALQAIIGAFSGGYGGTNGNGGVDYNSQGFVSHVYAKGGVVVGSKNLSSYSGRGVDRPTLFAFAKGNGLMGEAGPEAIMPLSRGSDGKLGVRMDGAAGGVVINVGVTVNSDGTSQVDASGSNQAFAKQFGQAMANAARQEIASALRPGGQIYNDRSRR